MLPSDFENDRSRSRSQLQFARPRLWLGLLGRYQLHFRRLCIVERNFANDAIRSAHVGKSYGAASVLASVHRVGGNRLSACGHLGAERVLELRVPYPFPVSAPEIVHGAAIAERNRHLVEFAVEVARLITHDEAVKQAGVDD